VLKVGLTGGIGSGKSEVTRRLAALGAYVVDADVLAREVVEPGTPGLAAVAAEFGAEVLRPDGSLDRDRLGAIVFADPAARARLNAIVHPLVGAATAERFAAAPADAIVVHDVPLLVEVGLAAAYDVVLVVAATPETQGSRLVRARGMSADEARSRIAAQAPLADKLAVADFVITNDGSLDDLDRQVQAVWLALQDRLRTRPS
jgi:dephospho-CoA kinase